MNERNISYIYMHWLRIHQCVSASEATQGWGLQKVRPLISPLREILMHKKYGLDTLNHVHICRVSPQ